MAQERAREFERRYRLVGTRLDGGYRKHSAFTDTKAHGTPTPETVTSVDFSFSSGRGIRLEDMSGLISLRLGNSYFVHGVSTSEMGTPGANGVRPESAA